MSCFQKLGSLPGAILCVFIMSSAPASALSLSDTKTLLDRTSFGMSLGDVSAFSSLTRQQAVDKVLAELVHPSSDAPPPFVNAPRPDYWGAGWETQKTVLYRVSERDQLQVWWIREMIETKTPFAEKLALFWHNHFVSRFDPGRVSAPFYDQIMLFKSADALNLRRLLRGILRDPMMLTSLDNVHNTRSHPNENLARELLELFTLGIGNYSETDVKQVAKVLAGHGVDRAGGWAYKLDKTQTNRDEKTVLGVTVKAGSDDDIDALVDILLSKPQLSRFIAAKFYAEFVSLDDNAAEVERLAAVLRDNDYDMVPFLRALLLSDGFWAQENRGGLVKSHLDFIVGFMRSFELRLPDYGILVNYAADLGQSPFMAPSVAGWRGGEAWLTMKSLDERQRIVKRLWMAYDDARRQRPVEEGDLVVRLSSEQLDMPAPVVIEVNGKVVGRATAMFGTDTSKERASSEPGGLKPMWETVSIPRATLPETVETVTVRLAAKNPDTRLFVNWVAVDGQRLSPANATWDLGDDTSYAGVPKGMFYRDVGLTFKVERVTDKQAAMDDLSAPHNSIIEYGTGRLRAEGASRLDVPSAPDFERDAANLSSALAAKGNPFDLQAFLMSAQPIYGRPITPVSDHGLLEDARVLTTDPSYNLK